MIHTTNYTNTFIAVAEDCATPMAVVPPTKDSPTVAQQQFALLSTQPYRLTSDEVLFAVAALRQGWPEPEWHDQRTAFFAKGQPCFRSSPLPKTYGWGIHYDEQGRMALYGLGSDAYERLSQDPALTQLKAMRSSRKAAAMPRRG